MKKQAVKTLFTKFVPYFVNYYAGIGFGLLFTCICIIPLRFLKIMDDRLGCFITGIIPTVIIMFRQSWRKGYSVNSSTYTFSFKKAMLFVTMTFAIQILLALLIAPTVYIAGPTAWLSDYFTSPILVSSEYPVAVHDWLLMLIADITLYAPCMITGEYLGTKQHSKDFNKTN